MKDIRIGIIGTGIIAHAIWTVQRTCVQVVAPATWRTNAAFCTSLTFPPLCGFRKMLERMI